MHVLIGLLALAVVIVLLYGTIRGKSRTAIRQQAPPIKRPPCVVCKQAMEPGDKLHTRVVELGSKTAVIEQFVYIYGCNHCDPRSKGVNERRCPVCTKVLEKEHTLHGRLYSGEGRSHLRVVGCSQCHRGHG